jgi:hypothetical protein
VIRVFRGLKNFRLFRFFQETIARSIELAPFARGQTANAGLRDLVENRRSPAVTLIVLV